MAYRQMPIEQVKISDLRLDIDNFRIPIKQLNEHAAMNYLFAEHDVRSVASLILRDGYIDNEIPMVTAEGGSYVILEGNRRLSALRAYSTRVSFLPIRRALSVYSSDSQLKLPTSPTKSE